jgi:uracil-DNA glycosylase family 4
MKGFFEKEKLNNSKPSGKPHSCTSCGLYKNALSPKMQPYGDFEKGIMNIGEAPGEAEDKKGKPWQGKMGRLLKRTYEKLGIDLFKDCININTVNCRPQNNATPNPHQIASCRERQVLKAIEEYKPRVIILLGGTALSSIIGYRWKKDMGGITKWRGYTIPDQDFRAWICPVFHPSYVNRMNLTEVNNIWEQDLHAALKKNEHRVPKTKEPNIHYIDDLRPLDNIKNSMVAIDYETTGLKPQANGHRIVCASVAYDEDNVYTFMIPNSKQEKMPLIRLWQNPDISKIAANMKFEDNWTYYRLHRTKIRSWHFDTMQGAHVLDNRPGVTGLKFQTYVNFGIIDYDSEVSPYLRSGSKNGNGLNKVLDLVKKPEGKEKLLKYCAYDSVYEYRLATVQIEQIDWDYLPF